MRPFPRLIARLVARLGGLAFALSLGGCLAGSLDANSRPSVIPKLSELPGDAEKRDGILDQSGRTAGPENRKGMTKRERKIETTAAFAAAMIGSWFSKSQNVTLGMATTVDENHLFEKPAPARSKAKSDKDAVKGDAAPAANELVPWVNLAPGSPSPPSSP
jgi:hypothetical protein